MAISPIQLDPFVGVAVRLACNRSLVRGSVQEIFLDEATSSAFQKIDLSRIRFSALEIVVADEDETTCPSTFAIYQNLRSDEPFSVLFLLF